MVATKDEYIEVALAHDIWIFNPNFSFGLTKTSIFFSVCLISLPLQKRGSILLPSHQDSNSYVPTRSKKIGSLYGYSGIWQAHTYDFPIRTSPSNWRKRLFLWVCFNFSSPEKKEVPFPFPSHQDSQLLCIHEIKNIGSSDGYNGIWLAHYLSFQILNFSFLQRNCP